MSKSLTIAAFAVIFAAPAFATDLPAPRVNYVNTGHLPTVCEPSNVEAVRRMPKGPARTAQMRKIDSQCAGITGRGWVKTVPQQQAYVPAAPVPYTGSLCNRYGGNAGIGGSGYVVGVGVNGGVKVKDVKQGYAGASTSTLTFGEIGIEANVCKTLADGIWGRGRVGADFGLNSSDQDFPGGYHRTNKDDRSFFVGGDLMFDVSRNVALGGGIGYSWDSLRAITTGPKGYYDDRKANGEYFLISGVVDYALTEQVDLQARYTYKTGVSFDTPTPAGKPDEHLFKVGANFKF